MCFCLNKAELGLLKANISDPNKPTPWGLSLARSAGGCLAVGALHSVLHHPLYILHALPVGWHQVEHLVCLNPVVFLQRRVCLHAWPLESVVISWVLSLLEGSSDKLAVCRWGEEDQLCLWDPLCREDQLLHPDSFWLGCTCSLNCCFRSQKWSPSLREDQQSSTPIFCTHFPTEWMHETAREKLILFCFRDLISLRPFPKVKSRSVVKLLCCIKGA